MVFGRRHELLALFRKMSSPNLKEMLISNSQRIIWMDLEMTGLEVEKDKIIEAACSITDSELNIITKFPSIIIHASDEVLNGMNDWSTKQHAESGLTEASRKSKVSLQEAEMKLLSFVRQYTAPNHCPLAGNSIHVDKTFIQKHMPELFKHFHYRIIDVSTMKELCRRWYPTEFSMLPQKKYGHRASDDIEESIEELKYYRKHIFKSSEII